MHHRFHAYLIQTCHPDDVSKIGFVSGHFTAPEKERMCQEACDPSTGIVIFLQTLVFAAGIKFYNIGFVIMAMCPVSFFFLYLFADPSTIFFYRIH